MSNKYAPPPPGLTNPTQKGMLAGNPRDSAIASNQQSNQKLNNLNKIGGKNGVKKRRMKKQKGGVTPQSNQVVVPIVKTPYTPTGGPGQTPTDVQQQNAQTSTQASANSVYDKYATQKGGKKTKKMKKRGGSSKWNWPCYSGGYKKTKKHRQRK